MANGGVLTAGGVLSIMTVELPYAVQRLGLAGPGHHFGSIAGAIACHR
ncbi:MAG: hypothetical protein ACKN9U_10495 [Pirellulaceae bacterium]